MNFHQNKSSSISKRLDIASILLIKNLLHTEQADVSELEEGGTLPNIDGYISLLEDDESKWKFTVQVKHLTHSPNESARAFYDIPASILGYAQWHKGEVVLFMACDTEKEAIYWKCIDGEFIHDCSLKEEQKTFRYHFNPDECLCRKTLDRTLQKWKEIYEVKMASIKNEDNLLEAWIREQEYAFDRVRDVFFGLDNSHIRRKETSEILKWIKSPLGNGEKPVKVLVGKAGSGKSVILKTVIQQLHQSDIGCLSIKADRWLGFDDNTVTFLKSALNYHLRRQQTAVLIIDQIDALSQYMSEDRKRLNCILDVVATLTKTCPPGIKILISCREYDLKFDVALQSLGQYSAIILGTLSVNEVTNVLGLLDTELPKKMSKKTFDLLSVPQYLDIFCMLYRSGRLCNSYENNIDLYDELWRYIMSDVTSADVEKIENLLFLLANEMRKYQTLNLVWRSPDSDDRLVAYLASKGVICIDDNRISFFHQTFYEYILARHYVYSGKKLTSDLETEFQGLEIRPLVKLVLDYERGHSESAYRTDIEDLIFSRKIRLHLKLLVLSAISASEDVRTSERTIVKRLAGYDMRLMSYFLSHTSNGYWFDTISRIIEPSLSDLSQDSEWFIPVRNSLALYAAQFYNEVYTLIDIVKDMSVRKSLAEFVLRSHNDYSSSKVRSWYYAFKQEHPFWLISCLKDALDTNVNFVACEVGYFLQSKLYSLEQEDNDLDYYNLKEICDKLKEICPRKFLQILLDCFSSVVSDSSKSIADDSGYSVNSVFRHYDMSKPAEKIFSWIEELLPQFSSESDFIKPTISRLLSLNHEMAFALAYGAMADCPEVFDDEIRKIVSEDSSLDHGLESGYFKYSFLLMLKNWFQIQNGLSSRWYQERLMTFSSYTDFFHSKERVADRPIFTYLWWRKWGLICNTVPDDKMTRQMRLLSCELMRKFGSKYLCKPPNRHILCGTAVGSLIPESAYRNFSKRMWMDSFLKLDGEKAFRKGVFHPVNLGEHAACFSKIVAEHPEYYRNFVFKIFARNDIKDIYKVAGLEGLLTGGLDPLELRSLFKMLMTEEFVAGNAYRFSSLAEFYIKKDSDFLDELVSFLKGLIIKPLILPKIDENEIPREKNLKILNHTIHSFQGQALKTLVTMNAIASRREQIYGLLRMIRNQLHYSLRNEVLYYLYSAKYYDEQLFDALLPEYLEEAGPEILFFCTEMIQHYYYHKNHLVGPYVESLIPDKSVHNILAQIFFYGTGQEVTGALCKENLDELLSVCDDDTVSCTVNVAMSNIDDLAFSELSENILLKYSNSDNDKVIKAYQINCAKLPVSSFDLFLKISENWKESESGFSYAQLKYLKKCLWIYPEKCYRYIQEHHFLEKRESMFYFDNILELLLGVYRKLKEDENRLEMENLMDLFDEYIFKDNARIDAILKAEYN